MTLNSADEIEVFKKNLSGEDVQFVELVPKSKDPNWFRDACTSGLKCDVLVISGHFGGLFFGEQSSSTIGLDEMERASCNNSCEGILKNPKEVFLMGCNTLATQKRDHRTLDQYLNVLVGDGIPMDFAEQVVSSRYSQQGFTLEKRFAAIFPKVKKLYGFSSTGPLGPQAGAKLDRYIKEVRPYSLHLDNLSTKENASLAKQFRGSSFQETNPAKVLDGVSRDLFCAVRSENLLEKTAAVQNIVDSGRITAFFDTLAAHIGSGVQAGAGTLAELERIAKNNRTFITIQHQVLQVSRALGLISNETKLKRVEALLQQAYGQQLTYPKISQICGILRQEPELQNLDLKSLYRLNQASPYFMLSLGCVTHISQDLKTFLLDKIISPLRPAERTIALQVMKEHWTNADLSWIRDVIAHDDQKLNLRLYLSARRILFGVRSGVLNANSSGLASCLVASERQNGENMAQNWDCLTKHIYEHTADTCDHFADLNRDPENADDMRWFCWDKRRQSFLASRAECYLLADTMGILGNKMKQVWNCTER